MIMDEMNKPKSPTKRDAVFMKLGDRSPEQLADKLADDFIAKIDEERAKRGLDPLPEE